MTIFLQNLRGQEAFYVFLQLLLYNVHSDLQTPRCVFVEIDSISPQTRARAAAAGEDGARGGAEADPRRHQRHGEHHQAVRGQQEERTGELEI